MTAAPTDWLDVGRASTQGDLVIAPVVAVPEDRLAEVQALYSMLDPGLPPLQRDMVDLAVRSPAVTILAALERASLRLAGLVTVVAAPTLARPRAWAEDLVVHPDFRGLGAGAALMAACEAVAAAAGAPIIDGTVHPRRESAVALYRRIGWEFSESLPVRRHLVPGGGRLGSTRSAPDRAR